MEVRRQLMNMVSVLDLKQIMLGYAKKAVYIVKVLGIYDSLCVYLFVVFICLTEERRETFYQQPLELPRHVSQRSRNRFCSNSGV